MSILFLALAAFFGVCFYKISCQANEKNSEGLGAAAVGLFFVIITCVVSAAIIAYAAETAGCMPK
jgi:multisubunit Na+/H+ antiporter MnhG subunit